jgi:hypothetical protein
LSSATRIMTETGLQTTGRTTEEGLMARGIKDERGCMTGAGYKRNNPELRVGKQIA